MMPPGILDSLVLALVLSTATEPADDPVVATLDVGVVRRSDVGREGRFATRDELRFRTESGIPVERSLREWTERQALRTIARHRLAEDPARATVLASGERRGRDWFLARWHGRCYDLAVPEVDPAAVTAELAAEGVAAHPSRLRLSHLFLRTGDAASEATARAQLLAWRAEVDDLASFQRLARARSQSATAGRGGALGWLHRGWLPASVEAELYPLPAGSVSEPVAYRGGLHLFYVEANDPGGTELPAWRIDRRLAERRAERLAGCRAVRLRQAAIALPAAAASAIEAAATVKEREDELLLVLARTSGALGDEEARHLEDLAADGLLGALLESRLAPVAAAPSEPAIAARYATRPDRYRTPLVLTVERLTTRLTAGTDPLTFRDQVFSLADDLRAGATTFAQAAAALAGATWEQLPPLDPPALAERIGPFLLGQVSALPAGAVTAPLQDQDGSELTILRVVARQESRRRSLDEARPAILAELGREERAAARGEAVRALLAAHHYRLRDDADQLLAPLIDLVPTGDAP